MKVIKTTYSLMLLSLVGMFMISCEKNINLDIPNAQEKIVIEGSIELNQYPQVFLTRNISYFGTVSIDSTMLFNLIVKNAVVKVTDGVQTDSLVMTYNPLTFPPIVYQGSKIKGAVGKTYWLTVKAEGKTYTAITTIPPPVPLDSVWFKVEPGKDSLGYLWATFTDPPELGNYYRLFTKRINKDSLFIPILSSVYDDRLFNGQHFTFSMMRGEQTYTTTQQDPEFGYFSKGDVIVLKACSIDMATYDFWRTAESEMLGGNNPFTNPAQIQSNIIGDGALGVWGGYGSTLDTIVAK